MRSYDRRRQSVFFLLVAAFGGVGFYAGTLAHRTPRDPLVLFTIVVWFGLFASVLMVRDLDGTRPEPP